VAVVEAGGFVETEAGNVTQVPAYEGFNSVGQDDSLIGVNPLTDWRFLTTPQSGADGRVFHYPRGKGLGGSSNNNNFEFNRATVGAMKKWAEQVDDDSYLWENVLPYYKRSVHFTPPNSNTVPHNASIGYDAAAFSATGGPLQVSYANYIYAFGSWVRKAFSELELSVNEDGFQSGHLIGHQYLPQTYDPKDEIRSSSATSFLATALRETDLQVYTHSFVQKILFDNNKRAVAVEVEAGGVRFQLNATREVILSAGVFQSPQLLMVSGIGPASTLTQLGIDVIADRPGMGQNMWDNIAFGPSYELDLETSAIISNPAYASDIVTGYLQHKTGPLTNVGSDYIAFERLSGEPSSNFTAETLHALSTFPSDWPEAEFLAGSSYLGAGVGPPDGKNYGTIIVGLLAMLSRGNLTIASADMHDPPVINPNWFTDPADQQVAIAAFKRARAVWATNAIRPAVIGDEVWLGSNVITDEEILDYVHSTLLTFYHAAGTVAMGKTSDSHACVDSRARVIGVEGLRVVDISAFPFLPYVVLLELALLEALTVALDQVNHRRPCTCWQRKLQTAY
jgi:choline dehydrogenase